MSSAYLIPMEVLSKILIFRPCRDFIRELNEVILQWEVATQDAKEDYYAFNGEYIDIQFSFGEFV